MYHSLFKKRLVDLGVASILLTLLFIAGALLMRTASSPQFFAEATVAWSATGERWQLIAVLVALGLLTPLLAYAGVDVMRRWAQRGRLLDVPNERSSHVQPTPSGGGLVIVLVATLGLIVAWLRYPTLPAPSLVAYLAGAYLIAVVSWLDDLRSLSNRIRFAAHSLAALLVMLAFGYWHAVHLPLLGTLTLGWLGLPLTFLWLIGLTNAYNFMDGIDGIAGGQALVAGLGWGALGWLVGQPLICLLGALLAASALGFLGHNWPPARIFMGDVGSAFLGFTFAVLPMVAAQSEPRLVLAGALLVWPFLFDALFTFVRRARLGENVFAAHRSHLYQRLVIAGYSHRFVSALYGLLACVGVLLAVGWLLAFPFAAIGVPAVVAALCLGLRSFTLFTERTSL